MENWKDSKSDTVKESIAKCNVETKSRSEPKATTKPKAKPTAETKAKAKADAEAKSTPKPFRVEDRRSLGSFEQSRKFETNEKRKMMEADVQGVSQATTVAVALQKTMAVCSGGAAETQTQLYGKRVTRVTFQ